jgi:hypothetical protein
MMGMIAELAAGMMQGFVTPYVILHGARNMYPHYANYCLLKDGYVS